MMHQCGEVWVFAAADRTHVSCTAPSRSDTKGGVVSGIANAIIDVVAIDWTLATALLKVKQHFPPRCEGLVATRTDVKQLNRSVSMLESS